MKGRGASFTDRVKAALARHRAPRACCRRAELSAILRSAGTFHIVGGSRFALEVDVPDAGIARKVYAGLAAGFAERAEIRILEPGRGRPRQRFLIRVQEAALDPFIDAGVLDGSGRVRAGVPAKLVSRRCCAGAYLRGSFLAHGSVSEPRAPVQFEIRTPDRRTADGVHGLAERIGAVARIREHRGAHVVYLKEGAGVGRMLAAMGAHDGYLEWEEGAVWKSVRGEANRLANCDEANARRTARAAIEQRVWAENALARFGEEGLPPAIREVAHLRLAHPGATLEELGRLCRPPITKPAVAGRIRRLGALAEDLVG
ncbi:MAG: DNA-binding protein WhiA [Actinomycetota bacterium]